MKFITAVLVALAVQQAAPPPTAQCKLVRGGQIFEGTCTALSGEVPSFRLERSASLKSGRYQTSPKPVATYAGEMRIPAGAVPIEFELYAGGTGILRPDGLTWLVVTGSKTSADVLEFSIDPAASVPASDLDRDIITRAAAMLNSEAVWDRADDRVCGKDDKTWSIYCAMIRATEEVTGGIHHRRPAMEVVRQVVDRRSSGRSYQHRLRDYNNDKTTTLADVRSLFQEALARLKH